MSPRAGELLLWGANHLPLTVHQPWRLITATFLHGGLIHIAFNMWVLWDTGRLAERFYGNGQFVLIYFVAGLAGSIASLFFSARTGVSVGASGAIFGVVGCLLAAIFTKSSKLPPGLMASMRSSMLMFIAYSMVMGFVVGFIDNAAHIGGLIGGFLMGIVLAEMLVAAAEMEVDLRHDHLVVTEPAPRLLHTQPGRLELRIPRKRPVRHLIQAQGQRPGGNTRGGGNEGEGEEKKKSEHNGAAGWSWQTQPRREEGRPLPVRTERRRDGNARTLRGKRRGAHRESGADGEKPAG
jgi:rhomboid protease GluP